MWHTFWSCLIRCVNIKWIRRVLWKIQSGHHTVHRQKNRQGETSISPSTLLSGGYKNQHECHCHNLEAYNKQITGGSPPCGQGSKSAYYTHEAPMGKWPRCCTSTGQDGSKELDLEWMPMHIYRPRRLQWIWFGVNRPSACRVPGFARFQEPFSRPWACALCLHRQMTMTLYIYRPRQFQLEQLERLHSEDTPCHLMITHTIESYWIPSQKKTKSKLQISRICQNFKFLNFETNITRDTPSEVAW